MSRQIPRLGPCAVFLLSLAFSSASADPAPDVGWPRVEPGGLLPPSPFGSGPREGEKPFERVRYHLETRLAPADVSPAEMRLEAWKEGLSRAPALARGGGWFTVGPFDQSGRCIAIDFHPSDASIVYVGTAGGGLWKSTNGGDTWTPLTDHLASLSVGAIEVLPWNPDVVLAGTGEGNGAPFFYGFNDPFGVGLLKSTDAGLTWTTTTLQYSIAGSHGFNVIESEPTTGVILAAANDGLWRSTDEGDTWTQIESGGNVFDVQWKPGDPDRVYVAKGRDPFTNLTTNDAGVKVSTDGGLTFTIAGTGQPAPATVAKTKIGVTAADPSVIYAHYATFSANPLTSPTLGIYRSTDDGVTWQLRYGGPSISTGRGWYMVSLAVDPDDPDRLITGSYNVYTSVDGGMNLSAVAFQPGFGSETVPHIDHHELVYEPGSTDHLWLACDGGVWRSTDDGATWLSRREGIVSQQYYDICLARSDPFVMAAGAMDNGIVWRPDSTTWRISTVLTDGANCVIKPGNASRGFHVGHFGPRQRTTNGGIAWIDIDVGIGPTSAYLPALAGDPNRGNHLMTSADAGIFHTNDPVAGWTNVASHTARSISISPVDGDVTWTTSNFFGTHVTTDDGVTWTQLVSFPSAGTETHVVAHPTDVAGAFVTFGNYATGLPKVVRTTDLGATWSDVTGDLPDIPVSSIAVDPLSPDDWYLATDSGVWSSSDGGVSWLPFGAGLPNVVVTELEFRVTPHKLVAGTYGRGVWEIDMSSGTDVAVGSSPIRDLLLDPPYPNPVRDRAVFRFAARSEGSVLLEIFDVAGRRVSAAAGLPRGDGVIRTVPWLTDDVPSGVYFAVLSADGRRLSRKVVVTR